MNSLMVIAPYKHLGMWVFDDERKGLTQEPFIAGADEIIDQWTAGIADAEGGFRLVFSPTPFPGHTLHLEWRRAETGGNVYYAKQLDREGWLCPALLKYFDSPPPEIFAKCEAMPTG